MNYSVAVNIRLTEQQKKMLDILCELRDDKPTRSEYLRELLYAAWAAQRADKPGV